RSCVATAFRLRRFRGNPRLNQLFWRLLGLRLSGDRRLRGRGSNSRRRDSADPLLRLDKLLQIGEIIGHQARSTLPQLNERYPERPGATIAAQHVESGVSGVVNHQLLLKGTFWSGDDNGVS